MSVPALTEELEDPGEQVEQVEPLVVVGPESTRGLEAGADPWEAEAGLWIT